MLEIAQLPVGHEFAPVPFQLRPEEVDLYLRAVGETNPIFPEQGLAPPTALAAYALRGILRELNLPPGAVHAAQEMSFLRAVAPEGVLLFNAKVAQNVVRGGWRFLAIDFSGTGTDGRPAIEGRSTVLIPEGQGERGADEAR